MNNKLTRSTTDYMLSGVCGGLAQYFGLDSTLVRLGYAVITIFSAGFPGIVLYILMHFIVPKA
ncbi:MAG: PspC domain-containing protein [Bacteroidaceae bacterium]|nr:PspC domain-containing protein [Bacteroidaceae bacterium]